MIPFSNRKFWPLFWTQFLGALNDNVLKNAMVVMITYKGLSVMGLDSPSIVALSGGIFILPFFLFSMVAGQIADKHEKSRLVRIVKVWELLITLLSSLGFYFHQVGLLLGALFMMGMHSTFFGPIKYSALPDVVEPEFLVAANAYVEVGTFLAILLGTIGGGVIIALPNGEVYTSVAINFLAILGLIASWRIVNLPSGAKHLNINLSPVTPVIDTVRLLRNQPEMFSAILAISWFWFFGAAVLSILPPYCKDFLKVDEHVITSFLAMYTLGIGLGCLLGERLSFKRAELGLVPMGAIGLTIFLFDLCMVRPELNPSHEGLMTISAFLGTSYGLRLLFDFLMMSVSGGLFILPLYTLLQERCNKEYRSRVIAGNNVFNAIFMVISAGLVMAFHLLGATTAQTFMALVAGNILFCGYIFLTVPEFILRLRAWVRARLG